MKTQTIDMSDYYNADELLSGSPKGTGEWFNDNGIMVYVQNGVVLRALDMETYLIMTGNTASEKGVTM